MTWQPEQSLPPISLYTTSSQSPPDAGRNRRLTVIFGTTQGHLGPPPWIVARRIIATQITGSAPNNNNRHHQVITQQQQDRQIQRQPSAAFLAPGFCGIAHLYSKTPAFSNVGGSRCGWSMVPHLLLDLASLDISLSALDRPGTVTKHPGHQLP